MAEEDRIVLIALLSDIHANREAYEACLAAVDKLGAERLVILGDIVGYGPDPEWCVEKTRALQDAGALVVRGNHDQACKDASQTMTDAARRAMDWTRNQLSEDARRYLGSLPMSLVDDDRLYIHAEASEPARWRYVLSSDEAARHLGACSATVSFCGHTHRPALYSLSPTGKVTHFTPCSDQPIPLSASRRWLAVMGAVGQPRDDNSKAAIGLYDTEARTLRYLRVSYDIDKTVSKIHAACLPESLAGRLMAGR